MAEITHYRRFAGYDYSRGATLFITITTAPRRQVFGRVERGKMTLSELGREAVANLGRYFNTARLVLHECVVMPDHVHFLVYLRPGLDNHAAIKLINTTVGRYKSWVHHLWELATGHPEALWQQGFHDWLAMSREMLDAIRRYIAYNPLKWELRNNRGLARLVEPLESARLPMTEFWRGLGNAALLDDPARKLVALRVSRRCTSREIDALVGRLLAKAGTMTVLSGFISAGERAVLAALLAEPKAALVKVSPYALPHDYAPPVAWLDAIAENRLAVIARGNSPEELSRSACLDLNASIVEIADYAAYAKDGRVAWLKRP